MATFIRLKQIESGSALQTAAATGTDFSASVQQAVSQSLQTELSQSIINVIVNNVNAVLPNGVISSSTQINLSDAYGNISASQIVGTILADSVDFADIINKPTLVSGSEQIIGVLDSLNTFTSSLDNTFATDIELAVTTSNLNIDMGEF
jgi:hypothetical protein